jgi:hypothetical protein
MGTVLWLSIIWIAPLICFLQVNEARFKKNIVVGVTLPFKAREDEAVKAALKKYKTSMWTACGILMALAAGAFLLGMKKGKLLFKILAAVFFALGLFGLLQHLKILTGVPILSLGIPAVLSVYFDLFSGFVQALVFSLLTMVYVAGACPPPAEAEAAE